MFDSEDIFISPDLTKRMVSDACECVSSRLSELADAHISVSIATICELFKAHTMWGSKPLEWRRDPFYQNQDVRRFTVSISSDSELLGLCRMSNRIGQSELTIEKLQASRDHTHIFTGKMIAAFAEINLAIAAKFGFRKISVEQPFPFLLPKFQEAGFHTSYEPRGCIGHAELSVTDSTAVNWPACSRQYETLSR